MNKYKPKGIICLETEWKFIENEIDSHDLRSEQLLNFLSFFHKSKVIHRNILTRQDLEYYIKCFSKEPYLTEYEIIYFATHGTSGCICLEGESGDDKYVSLDELADMANGSFGNAVVHFSSCKTLENPEISSEFKRKTKAGLVCGYTTNVDMIKSSLADIALFDYLMHIDRNYGIILNEHRSNFRKTYKSLLDELGFIAY